ncbi:MAG TPA: alanine/ornithine racemase family PLP-dependent enzyme [Candidatus Binatia bacterium]|nr:alanine/ornithine racemase family PLP-dependent enzyme [Candidatus Binatia bacterium]
MSHPYVLIDLDKIEHNARTVVELCQAHGMEVVGVTKCTCGDPEIARAMRRGGVSAIGESQLENIRRLRDAGVDTPTMLLRLPSPAEADEVVATVDVSLNSEIATLAALSQAAQRRGRRHDVIIMVDLGDLREGLWPRDLTHFTREALPLPGIRIAGLGTNLACFGGVVPSEENMRRLCDLADEVERNFGLKLDRVSGANSSGLNLIAAGRMPARVNQARIGEAILLGRETTHRQPWPDTFQNAFSLHAEILELKRKPSAPLGERSEDAFGHLTAFENRGEIERALVNIGREEIAIEGLAPHDAQFKILGASSSYLVVDTSAAAGALKVGDELSFGLNYGALLTAMTSEYVKKKTLRKAFTTQLTSEAKSRYAHR